MVESWCFMTGVFTKDQHLMSCGNDSSIPGATVAIQGKYRLPTVISCHREARKGHHFSSQRKHGYSGNLTLDF